MSTARSRSKRGTETRSNSKLLKTAESRETLADVEIRIDSKPEYFQVETDYGDWSKRGNQKWNNRRKLEVQYRLTVPRTASLDEVETVNGSVSVSNFTNYTKISSVNGSVKAVNLSGTAKLSTVNGTTEADFNQLQPGSNISLSTVNGRVNLTIPSDANATVKADTVNGSITNDFGLPVRKGKYVGRDLYGKIGSGGMEIKLNSVNGGLAINRRNDGKNPNPAVNLLPQKSADDEDWDDDDDDSSNESARINRDVARAEKIANAEAVKEAKKAAKELKKIQPVLDIVIAESVNESTKAVTAVVTAETQAKIQEQMKIQSERLAARLRNINFNAGSPVIETKSDSFTVKGKPKIKIEAADCAVTVRGWDSNEVKYEFTHISKNLNRVPVEVNTEQRNSEITIEVKKTAKDDFPTGNHLLRLEVFVPKKSDLKITASGEIRLEGVSGNIELTANDGSINVRDGGEKLTLNLSDGIIRVIGFKGELIANVSDTDIFLEGDFEKIQARSSDGNIYLTLPENANALIQSNVDTTFEGVTSTKENPTSWRVGKGGGKYNFDLTDGEVFVRAANKIFVK